MESSIPQIERQKYVVHDPNVIDWDYSTETSMAEAFAPSLLPSFMEVEIQISSTMINTSPSNIHARYSFWSIRSLVNITIKSRSWIINTSLSYLVSCFHGVWYWSGWCLLDNSPGIDHDIVTKYSLHRAPLLQTCASYSTRTVLRRLRELSVRRMIPPLWGSGARATEILWLSQRPPRSCVQYCRRVRRHRREVGPDDDEVSPYKTSNDFSLHSMLSFAWLH